jgi:hypothetical protein
MILRGFHPALNSTQNVLSSPDRREFKLLVEDSELLSNFHFLIPLNK